MFFTEFLAPAIKILYSILQILTGPVKETYCQVRFQVTFVAASWTDREKFFAYQYFHICMECTIRHPQEFPAQENSHCIINLVCIFPFSCVMVTLVIIISQKLYRITLARISWMMYSSFFECRQDTPAAYLSSRKEFSIPQRILQIFLFLLERTAHLAGLLLYIHIYQVIPLNTVCVWTSCGMGALC